MDIGYEIENDRSRANFDRVIEYIGDDPERFAALMKIFYKGDEAVRLRSSWLMSDVAESHPGLVLPYLGKLLEILPMQDEHNGVKRHIARTLQFVDVPKRLRGKAYSYCIDLIADPSEAVAVRACALTAAARIAKDSPELMAELKMTAAGALPGTSAAFQARFRNTFK